MVAPKITKEELKRKMDMREDFVLLDVRNPVDYGKSDIRITGGLRIPLEELEARVAELDPEREVVAYCT
jgi:sulfur-carrier protein adenylyltransferase/sulfurtransferase